MDISDDSKLEMVKRHIILRGALREKQLSGKEKKKR